MKPSFSTTCSTSSTWPTSTRASARSRRTKHFSLIAGLLSIERWTVAVAAVLLLSGCDFVPKPRATPESSAEASSEQTTAPVANGADTAEGEIPAREEQASGEAGEEAIVPVPGAPDSFSDIVSRVRPAVVGIYTTQRVKTGYVQRGPYQFRPRVEERPGLGSGFVIDEEGYILTNSHVVSQADSIRIRTSDDRTFSAEVVGIDPLTDLAIIQVEPYEGIEALSFGDSDSVEVGDWLVAVGNPYGLSFSVTAGILSGRGRRDIPIEGPIRYVDFLQTDASINPGNSGGLLVDMNGDVIVITTAMNQSAQGIGFAIPSNMAKTIYEELKQSGRVERSWIGVRIAEVPKRLQESEDVTGALVTHVARGGPAAQAGVRPGDVITKFADQKISESDELPWLASTAGVGTEVDIEIYREGRNVLVSLVLGQMPN